MTMSSGPDQSTKWRIVYAPRTPPVMRMIDSITQMQDTVPIGKLISLLFESTSILGSQYDADRMQARLWRYRSMSATRAELQQTSYTSLQRTAILIDGTDRQTDRRTPDRYTDAFRLLYAASVSKLWHRPSV